MKKLYSFVRKNPDRSTTVIWTGYNIEDACIVFKGIYRDCFHHFYKIISREMTE